jgi:putative endonuclease
MWLWLKNWWEERRALPDRARTGVDGERLAAKFLRKTGGYRIVARNWRSPRDRRDEIDLVCRDGDALVFVEVKTRAADALVSGYHAVDQAKKRVMRRACAEYLRSFGANMRPCTYRFDVVEVRRPNRDGTKPEVYHFENVPLFPKDFQL